MGAGRDLDVLGELAVAGDRTMMRPVQPGEAKRCASAGSDFAPDVECRSRYRATYIGLIANTT
jgi:hypothetical protein